MGERSNYREGGGGERREEMGRERREGERGERGERERERRERREGERDRLQKYNV